MYVNERRKNNAGKNNTEECSLNRQVSAKQKIGENSIDGVRIQFSPRVQVYGSGQVIVQGWRVYLRHP